MPDYVRVKDKTTRHEYSIVASTFDKNAHELIEDPRKPATNTDGTPMPPKYFVDTKTLSGSVSGSLSSTSGGGSPVVVSPGQKAESDKEKS